MVAGRDRVAKEAAPPLALHTRARSTARACGKSHTVIAARSTYLLTTHEHKQVSKSGNQHTHSCTQQHARAGAKREDIKHVNDDRRQRKGGHKCGVQRMQVVAAQEACVDGSGVGNLDQHKARHCRRQVRQCMRQSDKQALSSDNGVKGWGCESGRDRMEPKPTTTPCTAHPGKWPSVKPMH